VFGVTVWLMSDRELQDLDRQRPTPAAAGPRKHRAGAISATLVCLKSAERFYDLGNTVYTIGGGYWNAR
jgi:hypothetical protein